MGTVNNSVSFGNYGIIQMLQKGGKSANVDLQKQLGSYSEKQIQNLSSIKADDFRQIVNYVNPKNKGAACFTDELTLTKCNNKIDVGSWRIGLNAKKNMLMRQTFANALAPGLKYVADNDKLSTLLSVVTGKQVRIAGRKAGGEVMLDAKGGVFSTNHLERKDIREAFKVYDESFNTVEGRKSVLMTMLTKIAGDNKKGDLMASVLNGIGRMQGEDFVAVLAQRLKDTFGLPEGKLKDLLTDMLKAKNLDASVVKEGDGYVDRSEAMQINSDVFLEKLNKLEQAVAQAAKESDLSRTLVVLLRNYANTHQDIASPKVRESLEALLPSAIAQFKKLEDASTVNKELSAYDKNFGGKKPLNIFLDEQFSNVLGKLLNKYVGKLDGNSNNFTNDFAVGKQMYSDLVEIASGFLDKVNDIQSAYREHLQFVAPNLFDKQENKVINLDIDSVEINLTTLDKKNAKEKAVQNDEFKFSSMYVFNKAFKATSIGLNTGDGSRKKLPRACFGLALESMTKIFARDFTKTDFCQEIINRNDTEPVNTNKLNTYWFDNETLGEEIKKDLDAYGEKLKFCSILGKTDKNNTGALTKEFSDSMEIVFKMVEEQFNNKGALNFVRNLFRSKVDQGLESVASDIFRDQVISTLLSKFYTTQTDEAVGKIEKGDKQVNVTDTYNKSAVLLVAIEKFSKELMGSLKKGNDVFKSMMSWLSDNKTKLGFNDKDLTEAQKVMVADYKDQLRAALQDVFDNDVDFSSLKGFDINDDKAFDATVQNLGKSVADKLKVKFENKVSAIQNTLTTLATNANEDYKVIHQEVEDAFKWKKTDFFDQNQGAKISFSNQSNSITVELSNAEELLFGDDGAVKTVFDNICNKKTAAIYLKFAKECSKKDSLTVRTYMNNSANKLSSDDKNNVISSMKGYMQNLTRVIFSEIQTQLGDAIKKSGGIKGDIAGMDEKAATLFLQKNQEKIGNYIKNHVANVYRNAVNNNGEINLSKIKTGKISVANLLTSDEINNFIKNEKDSGTDILNGLKTGLEKEKFAIWRVRKNDDFKAIYDEKDDFVKALAVSDAGTDKYRFLQSDDFEYDFYGSFINQQLEKANPLEVALVGKKPFCDKIVEDFKKGGCVEQLKTYVDDCIDAFNSDEFEYVNAYGFDSSTIGACRKRAVYQSGSEGGKGKNCLTKKTYDVNAAKKRYAEEVHTELMIKVRQIKLDANEAFKFLRKVEDHVQNRVDKLSNWWEENCLGVGKEANAQEKLSSYLQKAVLKEFNAKFVTELLNQIWLKDDVQDKVFQSISDEEFYSQKDKIQNFVSKEDLIDRIEKLNMVVTNLMEGVFSASSDNGLKQLINDAIAEQSKTNPAFATALDNYAKDNSQDAVSTLATNLEKLDFFKNMIKTEAGKYWNSCCKNGVFDKIKTEASINLKPIEQKPVEQKTENQAEQQIDAKVEQKTENQVEQKVEQNVENQVEEKSVEPEAFVIDFNKSDVNKAQTLKDVVINVLTGGAVAQEIHNVQDDDFKSAIEFLNDDAFLRDLYKSLLGTKFNDDVWNDVKETLKNNFIQKYYTNLMSGIDKAFNKDQKTISFAKTELNNEMFLNAYDDVLRARWQNRVTSAFGGMDKSVKQSMLVSLNHIINDKSADLMKPLPGDEQTVKGIIEKREERQMLLLSEIVTMLPLDSLFATEEAKREFINDDSSDVQINQLKMQKFLFDGIQAMLSGQSESNGVSKLTNSIDGVTPDRWGTFEQRLAFYKDFCVKSADRIETTRASFDNSFSEKFVRGDGFKQLFLSDLFLEDDKIEKFEDFGLDKNDVMLASLNLHAKVMPKFGREMRNQQDSVDKLPYMQSYKAFTEDMIAVQEKVKNARKGSNIRKVALKLFGTQNTELTATKFTTRSESLSFGKTTMLGDLNGLLTNLQPLFNAAIQKEIDNRAAAQKALSEVVNNVDKRTEWRQTTRAAIAAEMKLDPQNPDAAGKIENELAKRELAMLKSYFEDDLGLTSAEVNGICKKVLDMVLNGASHKSNVQKPEIKDENPEIIKLFGEKKAKQVDVAIAALKNVTPPTETSKHRNSFSGFIQRYAILKEAINIADKGND